MIPKAETLITSLGGEKTRWTQNAIDLAVRSPSVNRPFVEVKNGEDTGPRMTSVGHRACGWWFDVDVLLVVIVTHNMTSDIRPTL